MWPCMIGEPRAGRGLSVWQMFAACVKKGVCQQSFRVGSPETVREFLKNMTKQKPSCTEIIITISMGFMGLPSQLGKVLNILPKCCLWVADDVVNELTSQIVAASLAVHCDISSACGGQVCGAPDWKQHCSQHILLQQYSACRLH